MPFFTGRSTPNSPVTRSHALSHHPPRDVNLVLLLTFGFANTWCQALHLTSTVPCPAHTPDPAAEKTSDFWLFLSAGFFG